jgi:hypothetical protein
LDRNCWNIKEKINVLQQLFCRQEKVVPIGERINVLQQFFCRKEKVVPIGERINVPIREKRICLDVFGSDTKLKHKL